MPSVEGDQHPDLESMYPKTAARIAELRSQGHFVTWNTPGIAAEGEVIHTQQREGFGVDGLVFGGVVMPQAMFADKKTG